MLSRAFKYIWPASEARPLEIIGDSSGAFLWPDTTCNKFELQHFDQIVGPKALTSLPGKLCLVACQDLQQVLSAADSLPVLAVQCNRTVAKQATHSVL
jgi:hypothetical protein